MAQSELNLSLREGVGKGVARKLRVQGLIPAVIYGRGIESCPVSLDPRELKKAIATEAGWNTLLTVKGAGAFDGTTVILKDLQKSMLRREITHADFQTVDMKQQVHIMVPVHTTGTSAGEKLGGSLQIVRHELEVHCLPKDIPAAIIIDVTNLNVGDTVHIADILLPAGVVVPHDVNFTVLTLIGQKGETAEKEEVEAPAAS